MEWLKAILEDDEVKDKVVSIKKEMAKHFVPNEVYDKKKKELGEKDLDLTATKEKMEEVQKQVKDLETLEGDKVKLKEQLDAISSEHETFKEESENRLTNFQKKQAIEKGLRDAKANEETIDLLVDKFDLDGVQLDAESNIVDWDKHLEPIKDSRKSLFGEVEVGGHKLPDGPNSDPSTYKAKYDDALKAGDRLGAIKIKQEAFKEGEII